MNPLKIPDGACKLVVLLLSVVMLTACGGGGGSSGNNLYIGAPGSAPGILAPAPPANGSNSIAVVVDTGPAQASGQINIPYVSVTVCTPGTSGTTAACQTIDHVELDTGSYGLRLLKSALFSNLALPPAMSGNGAIGECVAFAIGTTWGSVRYADVYLGGEVARSVPIQDIGDTPGGAVTVPSDCSGTGAVQDTQALLGANGILGVGLFKNDCDLCLSQPVPGTYYTCNSGGCIDSSVTASQVVQNPVADFAQDNNGVLISLASIGTTGAAYSNVSGTLTFGISTQTDNSLGSATVYATDQYGNIQTTFNGATTTSFIDSGSNALFFADTTLMNTCAVNTWAYCPASSPLPLSASNMAAGATSGNPVSFSIVNADTLNAGVVAANIAGTWTGSTPQFDWGLPFFFGRPVYTAISGMSVAASGVHATGPFFAY